jgi:MOSC domain-containing protein YiiM
VEGRIEQILVAPVADGEMASLRQASLTSGGGVEGDRYLLGIGTYSDHSEQRGRALTLVEAEVLADVGLAGAQARRNLVTRGIRLNDLVGREFRIGEVVCRGARLCEPCLRLEQRTGVTVRTLLHRGGLCADILVGGVVRVGDRLELEPTEIIEARVDGTHLPGD